MKQIIKIGKIAAVIILSFIIVLLTASYLLKDKVGFIILNSLNKNLSVKINVDSYRLSFIKKFPSATLELNNATVFSSSGFNRTAFYKINTDTLFTARSVLMEFRLIDIIRANYTIDRIYARKGRLNLFSDTTGKVNYNISYKKSASGNEVTVIDLRKVYVSEIKAYYNNLSTHLIIKGMIKNGNLKSRISGDNIDFTSTGDLVIDLFQLYSFRTDKSIPAKVDVALLSSKKGVTFRKGHLNIDRYKFEMSGSVSSDNNLNIEATGKNLDIEKLEKWVPEKYILLVKDYSTTGVLNINSRFNGKLSRTSNPHIEIEFQFKKGRITFKKSDLDFRNMSFSGHFTNGSACRPETSSISLNDFRTDFGSSGYTGSATMRNLSDPVFDIAVKGRVYPKELKEFFAISRISEADGSADIDLKIRDAKLPHKEISINGLIDLKPSVSVTFNSLTCGISDNKYLFGNITGNLTFGNLTEARDLQFSYKEQRIKINGQFENLPEWLAGRNIKMEADADAVFDKLYPDIFIKDFSSNIKNNSSSKAIDLPDNIALNLNFRIDSLTYKTFSSSDIHGSLNYRPGLLTFKSFKMHSLNGTISGNGLLAQNKGKDFIAQGKFNVTKIDVNKTFTTFHNFGQNFLKAENIKGSLSGSFTILIPLDHYFKYNIKTITAEGNYLLLNGALVNFDPVKQLSSFIELSELENICFQKLENDFFIKDNYVYVPQMEVNSSAADLSVNGKHSFDNDYEYHVKVLLSEILSKKRVKSRTKETEFGVVEDDGLGRTSLLLKIVGKGDVAKVSYDIKATGAEVKRDIKKEKQTLKTILNQEYGWYKNDSTLNKNSKKEEKKKKFKITWDEDDSLKPSDNHKIE